MFNFDQRHFFMDLTTPGKSDDFSEKADETSYRTNNNYNYDFWEFLDRVGKQAEENGLTEDQLNHLLSDDDTAGFKNAPIS
jgi:hypothetical protein